MRGWLITHILGYVWYKMGRKMSAFITLYVTRKEALDSIKKKLDSISDEDLGNILDILEKHTLHNFIVSDLIANRNKEQSDSE